MQQCLEVIGSWRDPKLINEWTQDEWILLWRTTVRGGNYRRQDRVGGRMYTARFFIYSLCFMVIIRRPTLLSGALLPWCSMSPRPRNYRTRWLWVDTVNQKNSSVFKLFFLGFFFFFQWQRAEKLTNVDDTGTRETNVTLWGQKQQDQYIAKTLFTNTIRKSSRLSLDVHVAAVSVLLLWTDWAMP